MNYKTIDIDGINIFYREAGERSNPTLLLLHGFPTSSHMFRNLMKKLENDYHLIAPDYPGFGNSDRPSPSDFEYSFDHFAKLISRFVELLNINKYTLYVHDYGAPVGFRLAAMHPEKVDALISQNGNAYEEGLLPAWESTKAYWANPNNEEAINNILGILQPEFTKLQYVNGTRNPEKISPDNWNMDQYFLNREGNNEIQLKLIFDYQNNLKLYPSWHEYFRTYQPPALIAWGKNDMFFGPAGAKAFEQDLKTIEVHLLDTGHFPLEEDCDKSAKLIQNFLSKYVYKS